MHSENWYEGYSDGARDYHFPNDLKKKESLISEESLMFDPDYKAGYELGFEESEDFSAAFDEAVEELKPSRKLRK